MRKITNPNKNEISKINMLNVSFKITERYGYHINIKLMVTSLLTHINDRNITELFLYPSKMVRLPNYHLLINVD